MADQVAKDENSFRGETAGMIGHVVKEEPVENAGVDAGASTSQLVPAADGVGGYEEDPPEMIEPSNEVFSAVAEIASNVRAGQAAREIFELSPLERRIRENRSFNGGDWTSEELKALYDGITMYGTTDEALEVIQKNYCITRSFEQVLEKVNEIRTINIEHREDRMRAEGDHWLEIGYRDVRCAPKYVVKPEIDNWEAGIQRVNRQLRSQNDHPMRTAIENALLDTPNDSETPRVYKVTEYRHGRSYGKEQSISWQRLGSFFAGVVRHVRPLPALNALECAVALRIVDDVEEEVSQTITDEDKAIIRGWLTNIQMRHLCDFLPDTPYTVDNAAQILLDPLRTRLWSIPEQNCDLQLGSTDVEVEVD
ncbi:hypothetical protein COOONC_23394 [Cooperia oncophora]